ncbi:MAG: hypothetical protein Q9209_003493 [Squamulea sp. 1 TL-2023]
MDMPLSASVDVFICGGGPVGLLLAVQLQRMGISTYVVEATPMPYQHVRGRAAAISPRTLELLDQLGLADDLLQQGFVCKQTASFRYGQRIDNHALNFVTKIDDTAFNFILHLRQMSTRDIFQRALEKYGGHVSYGTRLTNFTYSGIAEGLKYNVMLERDNGTILAVEASYIIGADGANSRVRHISGVKFVGDASPLKGVRIDGIVKTNMPDSRIGPVFIESKSHGNVLWEPMDHGPTRISFPFTTGMQEKYRGRVTSGDIELETNLALDPFDLKFESINWWTIYDVGHHLAEAYFTPARIPSPNNRTIITASAGIFLAGDAAHTHTSGITQGMNAGLHDAINLAWKLAGVIKGWYYPQILTTYQGERRQAAATSIEFDKIFSSCMFGKVPEFWTGEMGDPAQMLKSLLGKQLSPLFFLPAKEGV